MAKRPFTSVVCIGGAMIDRKYRLLLPAEMGTSNPADLVLGFGGVARNVAVNLARLGMDVSLVAAVGADPAGAALVEDLKRNGVDARRCIGMQDAPTAEYAALLQPDGSLALGIVAAGSTEAALEAKIGRILASLPEGCAIFADCNLSSRALRKVIDAARRRERFLAVDAVSVRKAERLGIIGDLDGVSLLVLNRDEARALGGSGMASSRRLARQFRLMGAGMVVLTRGGGYAVGADGLDVFNQPPFRADVIDVSGAGDSLTATLLWRLSSGDSLRTALRWGMAAAAATTETFGSTHPALSADFLAAAVSRIATP
jgi:pseudouridine kinase